MKIVTDLEDVNFLLQSCIGSKVEISIYSSTFRRLALKLTLQNNNEVIYLAGICCEYINGRFSFTNAGFNHKNESRCCGGIITRVVDETASFELITSGGFSLLYGVEDEFGDSFSDFIKDKESISFS